MVFSKICILWAEMKANKGIIVQQKRYSTEQLALLSHYMHTRNTLAGECYRVDAETILQETPQMIDEDISMVAEPPAKYSLFPDFFSVPFPPIQPKSVPFIDLFAGIGGIRIPFDELGYNCVLHV